MRTQNKLFPFFFCADWELEGQQKSLPKSTWNKLLPQREKKAAYSFYFKLKCTGKEVEEQFVRQGSENEHFHTSTSAEVDGWWGTEGRARGGVE